MKKNIYKGLLIISIFVGLFLSYSALLNNIATIATAQSLDSAAKELAGDSPIKEPQDIFRILARIVQYAYTIFFIVAIIFILFAAFNFLTAQGDPEKIKGARAQILWAVVAIAIALISDGAAQIIKSFIKKKKNLGLPKSPINEPNQFLTVFADIVNWTYAIFFIITVMFVLFAAFNYLTGGDDAEKIKTAHQQIMYAAIAVAIALLAVGFSLIVKRFLGESGGGATNAIQNQQWSQETSKEIQERIFNPNQPPVYYQKQ